MDHKDIDTSRRNFLASSVRLAAFSGLGYFGVKEVIKKQKLGDECLKLDICISCIEFDSGCSLPKAEGTRSREENSKHKHG